MYTIIALKLIYPSESSREEFDEQVCDALGILDGVPVSL